jgi:lipoprotein-anchoring transpeptidase ErfK/SrfK
MYWYYKYPLYAILFLIILGIGYLVYTRLPSDVRDNITAIADGGGDEDAAGARPSATEPGGSTSGAVSTGTTNDPVVARQLQAAEQQLERNSPLAARTLARKILETAALAEFSRDWDRAARIISKANSTLFNSDAPAPEKVRHEVQSGDTLVGIAKKYNTTVEGLIRGNKRLDPTNSTIFPGMIIHAYVGDWSIIVDKEHFMLLLFDGGKLFRVYDVAIGRQDRTPIGTFKVVNRLREPDWTPPGRHIPYGDPENVLGTRWLGLKPTGDTDPTLKGYGIHGTWEPESIGTEASEGCIRMLNEDVNELFDIVTVGTEVLIRED